MYRLNVHVGQTMNEVPYPLGGIIDPLAGLHPTHSHLTLTAEEMGMPFTQLIAEIIKSASERVVKTD